MEMSSARWNSQQVGDDCNLNSIDHQLEMDPLDFDTLDDLTPEQYLLSLSTPEGISLDKSVLTPPECYNASFMDQELINNINEICDSFDERPAKQTKTNTWTSSAPKVVSSSGFLISFGNVSSPTTFEDFNQKNLDSNIDIAAAGASAGRVTKKSTNNTDAVAKPPYAQDHVIAERNRRQRLTESFIALSALVPGLKKLDKATVLRDAIQYVKKLQERVDLLEEEIKKKKPEESPVVSQNSSKPPAASLDDSSSCDENSGGSNSNKRVAEIDTRVSEKNVLIRIHCEKQKGSIPKMLTEIEKLNLSVVSSSMLPFGDYGMDITIICQMEAEFSFTAEGLIRKLRSALQ